MFRKKIVEILKVKKVKKVKRETKQGKVKGRRLRIKKILHTRRVHRTLEVTLVLW